MAKVNIKGGFKLNSEEKEAEERLEKIKKIGVWSVKGGVGKSTLSIAIAFELAKKEKTALLDGDISSPNISNYLGINDPLVGDKEKGEIYPIEIENVEIISMYNLIGKKAIAWRGVLLESAFRELLKKTRWKSKRMVIDLPPGSGDIMISAVANLGIKKFIIVTTPSRLSIEELKRSLDFLKKFNIEIVGIIENMSSSIYPSKKQEIERMGKFLTSIPYSKEIANAIERGIPINKVVDLSKVVEEIEKAWE